MEKPEEAIDYSGLANEVKIIASCDSKHLKKGEEYIVSKQTAIILSEKGIVDITG